LSKGPRVEEEREKLKWHHFYKIKMKSKCVVDGIRRKGGEVVCFRLTKTT